MTYLHRQSLTDRRKVAAWHTLWELGQAREALRRMGEVLEEPPARSREAYADAIYRLADESVERTNRHLRVLPGLGQEGNGPDDLRTVHRGHLDSTPTTVPSLLDGGLGDSTSVSSGGQGQRATDQAAVGRKPSWVPGVEPGGQATNFDTEGTTT